MQMPGMVMPGAPKKAQPRKPAAKRALGERPGATKRPKAAPPAAATPMEHEMTTMSHSPAPQPAPPMTMPMSPPPGAQPSEAPMGAMTMGAHAGHEMAMTGALGAYPMQRESSGTSWQPDSSEHMGLMNMSADWTLMAHGVVNLVYDHQSGPRGGDEGFASGMLMGMARRPLGEGTLQLKAMVSPDPLMGPSGYPLLLASGETANGRTRLIDRQHPHDLFMELSASLSEDIGTKASAFIYAGLPGEPAFGPPAFMHRESIMDSPEAPITHHWLDSTHISFGVVTAGLVVDRFKIEASRFNGREPDQHRWNIETAPLDSTSLRLSWNPTPALALQASWARLIDPEQLEPGVDQTRWSASALWARDVAPSWHAAATLAWGRKSSGGHNDDGIAVEGSLRHSGWIVFGRGEWTDNRELVERLDAPSYRVGKISLGSVRDFPVGGHLAIGAGGLFSLNFVPDELSRVYGGHNPMGAMGFVRLKLD
jgi:hypothetical protein